jgi:hypothetical protein
MARPKAKPAIIALEKAPRGEHPMEDRPTTRTVIQAVPTQVSQARKSKQPAHPTFSVRMDPDLQRQVRIAAATQDVTIEKLVSDAVQAHLDALNS